MKKNLVIYIPAVLAVLAVKLFYRTADSELLTCYAALSLYRSKSVCTSSPPAYK